MSKEIIEVLEYIGNKIGVTIDWTSENVWPQIIDIFSRYSKYEIVANIVTMSICVILMLISGYALAKVIRAYSKCSNEKEKNLFWKYYSEDYIVTTEACSIVLIVSCAAFAVTFILCAVCCSDLLKWVYIPEIQILDLLNTYLETH